MNEFYDEETLLLPDNMIRLYAGGAFPMAEKTGIINWYYPQIRTVIPLDGYNIPRSLKKFLNNDPFTYSLDKYPMDVIRHCADRNETWISDKLISAYSSLLDYGFLHSVEVYKDNLLAGGLYGIAVNGAFFGESMFTLEPQSSKAALVYLIKHLIKKEFSLLDVQYITNHLKMFGAVEISVEEYDELRLSGLETATSF